MKLLKKTPLRLLFDSKQQVGVGRHKGMEVIPNTPKACKDLGIPYSGPKDKEVTIPEAVQDKFNLFRDYQKEDALKLASMKSGGCFNQQRTGKTPVSLVTFGIKDINKYVIICPTSITYQWKDEVDKWTNKKAIIIEGTKKKREKLHDSERDVTIIGYELLRGRDLKFTDEEIKAFKDLKEKVPTGSYDLDQLLKWGFDGLIIDEGHRIKNHKALQSKRILKFRKHAEHLLILTGTPSPNKQEEIFGILKMLYPTLFTGYWRFVEYYFEQDITQFFKGGRMHDKKNVGRLKREEELQEFLNIISTNRRRKDVMDWLPEKDYIKIRLDLTKAQKRYINEIQEFFETDTLIIETPAERCIRERQICLSPKLVGLKGKSPKIDWIKQYIKDYPEERILIFSKFKQWLYLLAEELGTEDLYTGDQNSQERDKIKKDFQANKINLLLLQMDASKEGVTLGNATTAIFTDVFPPAGTVEQAEDRGVATSESGENLGLKVIQLMMKETYDELLYSAVEENLSETDVINNYKKYVIERRQ